MFAINTDYTMLYKLAVSIYNLRGPSSLKKEPAAFTHNPGMTDLASSQICAAAIKLADSNVETNVRIAGFLVAFVGQCASSPGCPNPSWTDARTAVDNARSKLGLTDIAPDFNTVANIPSEIAIEFMNLAIAGAQPTTKDVGTLKAASVMISSWASERRQVDRQIEAIEAKIPAPVPGEPTAYIVERRSGAGWLQIELAYNTTTETKERLWASYLKIARSNPNDTYRFTSIYK